MKIMHIAQAAGGVDRYLYSLLKYMDNNEYENICVFSQDYDKNKYENIGIKVIQTDMFREISAKDISAILKIRKIIKKYNPDIIYAHSSKAGAIARVANIGIKNICIYNPHGWAFNMKCSKIKKNIYIIIEKLLAQLTDKIVCISIAEQKSAIKERICKINKTVVINNGIDITEYVNSNVILTKKQLGIPENAYIIGCSGRLCEQKASDVFVKAADIINKKIDDTFFLLVGDGEKRIEVEQFFENNDMKDKYLITGWVKNPMDYIKLFDVALLISRWEGFGLVLAEYMLAGKPIVATNVDAIPYIIQNEINGLIAEVDNEFDIAQKVIRYINNDELRNQVIENGKKIVVENYDVQRMKNEYEKLFKEIINK